MPRKEHDAAPRRANIINNNGNVLHPQVENIAV